MRIGNKLKQRAIELGMSDAEVARGAGISTRTYGYYIENRSNPPLDKLEKICNTLNITPNYFFDIAAEQSNLPEINAQILREAIKTIFEKTKNHKNMENTYSEDQLYLAMALLYEELIDNSREKGVILPMHK